jgi:hypothetical protein
MLLPEFLKREVSRDIHVLLHVIVSRMVSLRHPQQISIRQNQTGTCISVGLFKAFPQRDGRSYSKKNRRAERFVLPRFLRSKACPEEHPYRHRKEIEIVPLAISSETLVNRVMGMVNADIRG